MVRHLLNESQSQGLRKGAWTQEEDELLRKCIEKYGAGKWRHVPKMAGLNRCRKSCRLRWVNYLNPGIKRGHFDADEEELVIRLHKLLGNRWSLIAGRLPGRTANDVKNYWNSHLRKKINTNHEIEDTIGVEVTGSDQQINFSKWTSSNDQMSSDSKHQEVKSNIPNPTSTLSNPVALTDNIIIPEESKHAILPAGFMAMEVDTSIRIEDIEGFDDEDLFFGTVGGWEYPLLGFDGWCDLGIL